MRWLATIGSLAWPIGYFAFGGPDDDVGRWIIGGGSALVLAALAAEYLPRLRAWPIDPAVRPAALLALGLTASALAMTDEWVGSGLVVATVVVVDLWTRTNRTT